MLAQNRARSNARRAIHEMTAEVFEHCCPRPASETPRLLSDAGFALQIGRSGLLRAGSARLNTQRPEASGLAAV